MFRIVSLALSVTVFVAYGFAQQVEFHAGTFKATCPPTMLYQLEIGFQKGESASVSLPYIAPPRMHEPRSDALKAEICDKTHRCVDAKATVWYDLVENEKLEGRMLLTTKDRQPLKFRFAVYRDSESPLYCE